MTQAAALTVRAYPRNTIDYHAAQNHKTTVRPSELVADRAVWRVVLWVWVHDTFHIVCGRAVLTTTKGGVMVSPRLAPIMGDS